MPEEEPDLKKSKKRPSAHEIVSSIFDPKKGDTRSPHEDSALFKPGPQPLTSHPVTETSPGSAEVKGAPKTKRKRRLLRVAKVVAEHLLSGKKKRHAIPKPGEWTSYSDYPIGIEIGTTAVKAIQLSKLNGKWELINCAIRPLPLSEKPSAGDFTKELKAVLTDIFPDPQAHFFTASTFTDPTSTVQVIKLPQIPQAEMRRAVAWELQEKFQMRSDDWYFDFEPLSPLPGAQQKNVHVLISAALKRELQLHAETLKSVGLLPLSVEIKPLPTLELLSNFSWPTEDAGLLIELGAEVSSMVVIVNAQPAFIHGLEFTGKILTKVIQGISGLSHNDADQFKCRVGLSQSTLLETTEETSGGSEENSGSDKEYQAYLAMRPFVDRFVTEIEQIFKYYSFRVSMSEVRSFSKIVLSGKTAKLKGLKEVLEEKLGVPVSYVDSFENVTVDSGVFSAEELNAESLGLATALGLAQQKIGHK